MQRRLGCHLPPQRKKYVNYTKSERALFHVTILEVLHWISKEGQVKQSPSGLEAAVKVSAVAVSVWYWSLRSPAPSVPRSYAAAVIKPSNTRGEKGSFLRPWLRHRLNEGQSFQRCLCFHKKYMQHQKDGYQVSRCSVCAHSRTYTAKYNTSACEALCVGVNTCANVKMKATAVSTAAVFTVKTPASDIADGVKEVWYNDQNKHWQLNMHLLDTPQDPLFLLPYLLDCARAYFIVNSCIIHSLHALSKSPDSNKSDRIIQGWELSGNFYFFFFPRNKTLALQAFWRRFKTISLKPQFIHPNMNSQVGDHSAWTKCPQAHTGGGFQGRQMNLSGVGGKRPRRGQQQLKMCCSLKKQLTNSEF